MITLEYDLFCEVRDTDRRGRWCASRRPQRRLPDLDVFASLALVADQNNYCRPKINENGIIDIKDGTSSGGGEDDQQRYVYCQ